jgi:DNA-binding CsgD family transcriptional regulator
LNEAIAINKRLNREYSLAENYNNMAFQYKTLHKYNEALKFLDLAYRISVKLESYEILSYNYQLKSEIFASQNRYEDAYNAVLKMHEVNNKLLEFQNFTDIEQLIVNRVISKNKYELSLQKKESDIKWLNFLLIAASTLLVVSILLIIYIYFYINSKRKLQLLETRQENAEKEIDYAQSELVNLATYLNSRNVILSNIQSSLSKAYKSSEKDIYTDIRKLNMYIKNLQTKNEDVESVLNKIAKINEDFISRLSEKHPEITKNDKNIALLLRANLTTKQIATILDCSPKSINMARYRIRIHLNLTANINLVSYLKTL